MFIGVVRCVLNGTPLKKGFLGRETKSVRIQYSHLLVPICTENVSMIRKIHMICRYSVGWHIFCMRFSISTRTKSADFLYLQELIHLFFYYRLKSLKKTYN